MHVRIAWEIYQHQHKGSSCPPPLSRAPPSLTHHLFRAPPPQLYAPPRPHEIYSSMVHAQQSFDQSLFLSQSLGKRKSPFKNERIICSNFFCVFFFLRWDALSRLWRDAPLQPSTPTHSSNSRAVDQVCHQYHLILTIHFISLT
jgi:hypothetical protein